MEEIIKNELQKQNEFPFVYKPPTFEELSKEKRIDTGLYGEE